MALRIRWFSSMVFTAVAMSAGLAHLFALPNKIGLSATDYFTVQQIYKGWASLGAVDGAALLSSGFLARALRHRSGFGLATLATSLIALALLVFFLFTFPANRATADWTIRPDDWAALRYQWEYSHAVAALLYLAALICLVTAALGGRPRRDVALFISH